LPASSLAVTVAALGAHQQAHRHASHRTGHHNGNRRTTMTLQHADIEHVARSGEHARDGHRQNARLHRNHAPSLASPAPPCPQTFLQVRRAKTTQGQHDSPVTCAPVGGQHAAQCMAACPPPPRGAVGVRDGAVPRPITPSCARTSNCRIECTSHSPASS
jgi:hypothetical protein